MDQAAERPTAFEALLLDLDTLILLELAEFLDLSRQGLELIDQLVALALGLLLGRAGETAGIARLLVEVIDRLLNHVALALEPGQAGCGVDFLALALNRIHGGGLLPWLFGLSPFALTELHRITREWLEEIRPEGEDE